MKRVKGFTLIELLIVVAIIAILAAIAVPNFLEAQVRSKVSRVRTDHRSMATAIESYYVDNNSYPACTVDTTTGATNTSAYAHLVAEGQSLAGVRTFRRRTDTPSGQLMTLTTPVAFITSYFPDPFADTKGATFAYFASFSGNGWILGSWGPDTDQKNGGNLQWKGTGTLYSGATATNPLGTGAGSAVETIYNPGIAQPSALLLTFGSTGTGAGAFTYDPTNGTVSAGDLWRVKQ